MIAVECGIEHHDHAAPAAPELKSDGTLVTVKVYTRHKRSSVDDEVLREFLLARRPGTLENRSCGVHHAESSLRQAEKYRAQTYGAVLVAASAWQPRHVVLKAMLGAS